MSRFSNTELEAYKKILEEKRNKYLSHQSHLVEEDPFSDTERVSDNAATDSEASEQEGHARVEAVQSEVHEGLERVSEALSRIKDGKFGACVHCGKEIELKRLKIDLTMRYCMDCHQKEETSAVR